MPTHAHPRRPLRTVLVALVLLAPVLLPLLTAAIYLVAGWGPRTAWLSTGSAVVVLAAVITLAAQVSTSGPRTTAGGLLRADALSAFMLLVVAVVARRGLRGHPGAPARRDQRRAGAHAHRNPAQRAGPGVPLRHGAGGARLQPGPVVGRGGGHHDRHRVPGRAAPHPRRGRGGVEVRGDLLDRDRDGPAGHLPAELRRRTRRDRSGLGRVDRERRRPGPRRHPDRGRAADPRIRDQSRAGPAALLAARRAQPSPRAGVRADVRGAARGRVLRHPARQGHRRRDAGHRFRPHPAGRDRARLPAGGRDPPDRAARLQTDARLLQHRAHGAAGTGRRHRRAPRHQRGAPAHAGSRPGQEHPVPQRRAHPADHGHQPDRLGSRRWPPAHR